MKFSPAIKYLSNQDFSCIHLGWSMPLVRPVTSWLSGFRSCSRYEHGWCCRDFLEPWFIQIEIAYQGRLRNKQCVFANLHRLESSFSAGWVLEVPQSTGANHKEFSYQQGFSFCPCCHSIFQTSPDWVQLCLRQEGEPGGGRKKVWCRWSSFRRHHHHYHCRHMLTHETCTYRAARGRMLEANTAEEHSVILERKATKL